MALFRSGIVLLAAAAMASGCVTSDLIPERFRSQQTAASSQSSANTASRNRVNPASAETASAGDAAQTEQALLTDKPEQVAARPSATRIGRADLLGGWKVTSGEDNCQLYMSLTGWAGGYRATTKGCNSPVLGNVQAWSLNGEEVTLLSGNGEPVIRLTAADKTRLNGKTTAGETVMIFR